MTQERQDAFARELKKLVPQLEYQLGKETAERLIRQGADSVKTRTSAQVRKLAEVDDIRAEIRGRLNRVRAERLIRALTDGSKR